LALPPFLIVKKLTDEAMLKMMAADNDDGED